MQFLTEILSESLGQVTERCEAEGRLLRQSVLRLAQGAAAVFLAAAVAAVGFALLAASAFLAATERFGAPLAALMAGAAALLVAGTIGWAGMRRARGRRA